MRRRSRRLRRRFRGRRRGFRLSQRRRRRRRRRLGVETRIGAVHDIGTIVVIVVDIVRFGAVKAEVIVSADAVDIFGVVGSWRSEREKVVVTAAGVLLFLRGRSFPFRRRRRCRR